jgi:hypothetical protein
MYLQVSHLVKEKADVIVDGLKTVEEITGDILRSIEFRLKKGYTETGIQ